MDNWRPCLPVSVYVEEQEIDRQGGMILIGDVENEETEFMIWLGERVERAREAVEHLLAELQVEVKEI